MFLLKFYAIIIKFTVLLTIVEINSLFHLRTLQFDLMTLWWKNEIDRNVPYI